MNNNRMHIPETVQLSFKMFFNISKNERNISDSTIRTI